MDEQLSINTYDLFQANYFKKTDNQTTMKTRSGLYYQPNYVGQKAFIDGRWVAHGFGRQVFMCPVSKRLKGYAGGYKNGKPHGYSILYYLDETHGARFDRYMARIPGHLYRGVRGNHVVRRQRLFGGAQERGKLHIPLADLQLDYAKLLMPLTNPLAATLECRHAAIPRHPYDWRNVVKETGRIWGSRAMCSAVDENAGAEINLFGKWPSHHTPYEVFEGTVLVTPPVIQYIDERGRCSDGEPAFSTFEPPTLAT